jgi:hypothetical protein
MNNSALIVGISNYSADLGPLPAVAADVRELRNLLSSGNSRFDAASVQTISDDDGTLDHISNGVGNLFTNAKKADTIFLYLAGHGIASSGDYYYLPIDTALGNIPGTALSLQHLRDLFEKCNSERAVMWLDFCHSGGILARAGGNAADDDAIEIERAFRQVQGFGKVIMTACTNEQKAYELASHGRFTSVLLRGLGGEASDRSGEVTVNGLHDFIDRNIGTVRQRPMFFGKMTGRIVLMRSRDVQPLFPTLPANASIQDKLKQTNDAIYANIVDTAARLCMFEQWEAWTSEAISTSPAWRKEWMDNVEEFRRCVIRVVWPGTIPELERAIKTLSLYLAMALESFGKHSERKEDGWYKEVRFYKSSGWNENYHRDLAAYNEWIDEQNDFMFEATKSANWVADVVRRELNPSFFAIPGKFIVTTGPYLESGGSFMTRALEYTDEEKKAQPEAVMAKKQAVYEAQQQQIKELLDEE